MLQWACIAGSVLEYIDGANPGKPVSCGGDGTHTSRLYSRSRSSIWDNFQVSFLGIDLVDQPAVKSGVRIRAECHDSYASDQSAVPPYAVLCRVPWCYAFYVPYLSNLSRYLWQTSEERLEKKA